MSVEFMKRREMKTIFGVTNCTVSMKWKDDYDIMNCNVKVVSYLIVSVVRIQLLRLRSRLWPRVLELSPVLSRVSLDSAPCNAMSLVLSACCLLTALRVCLLLLELDSKHVSEADQRKRNSRVWGNLSRNQVQVPPSSTARLRWCR
jgi:hypothetical protein